jgi:2,4-diaminopentanoate dehydrogenase
MRVRVALYGAGQVNQAVAAILAARRGVDILGPFRRADRKVALASGAEVVIVATTSFLADIAPDIEEAIENGSNVIVTAEEAAFPKAVDERIARKLDKIARRREVTILGAGLNPGFAFDALVLTATGAAPSVDSLLIERVVDLSGFGEVVLRRIGIGFTADEFQAGTTDGSITGHIGFPQSMRIVADRLGVEIDRIERVIEPLIAERSHEGRHVSVAAGMTAGFRQEYKAIVGRSPWFVAKFLGHLDPVSYGQPPRDRIELRGGSPIVLEISPGLNPQISAPAIVANSIPRVMTAEPGWRTVGELPPATPW